MELTYGALVRKNEGEFTLLVALYVVLEEERSEYLEVSSRKVA